MGGRVFISCGQATAEEQQAAASVGDWFKRRGFDPYIAIETQGIQDVNSGIIGELKKADYYVFIDFAREPLSGKEVSRGSLFTNQELAIAYVLGFEDVIFLQQEGVELEGLLKYMVANPVKFTGSSELPALLDRLVTDRRWKPTHSRHLVVTNLRWLGPAEEITYNDGPGNHWHAKPLYVDVENRREDIGAEKMKLRLAFVTSENGERLPSLDRSPLKATGRFGFEHDIWPKSHEAFDLLSIDTRAPHRIYLYSALDVRPRPPLLEQLGIYKLDFEGWALGFPLLRFSVVLKMTDDPRTTTADLDPRHWE